MTVDDFTFSPDSEMLSGDPLESHPLCAEVAAAVVWPQKPWRDRMLGKAGDFLLIETVPAMIRKRLGLESKSDKILEKVAPVAFRTLPKWLMYHPESYRAEKSMEDQPLKQCPFQAVLLIFYSRLMPADFLRRSSLPKVAQRW